MVCRTGQWRRQLCAVGGVACETWQTNSKLLSAYFIVYAHALPTVFAIDFQFGFLSSTLLFHAFPYNFAAAAEQESEREREREPTWLTACYNYKSDLRE